MREARAEDYRRAAAKKVLDERIVSISFENIKKLGNGEAVFGNVITAFSGLNGSGKTSLLLLIHSVANKTLEGSGLWAGEDSKCEATWSNGQIPVHLFECTSAADNFRSKVYCQPNMQDLLDGVDPVKFDKEALKELSYLVGKDYTDCDIFEMADVGEGLPEIVPYFMVTIDGYSYGCENMGLGELGLHLFYHFIRNLSAPCVLLLDEPENRVSVRSQKAIIDILMKYCVSKSIQAIVTTHSSAILSRIQKINTRILSRQKENVDIIHEVKDFHLDRVLELRPQYKGVIAVEDKAAAAFAKVMFKDRSQDLLRNFEIVICGSDGDIISALERTPIMHGWFTLLGLFDGDIKPQDSRLQSCKWRFAFLPGDSAPENILRPIAKSASTEIASRCAMNVTDVNFALESFEGYDHHDWLTSLSAHLDQPFDTIVEVLYTTWVATNGNDKRVNESVAAIYKALQNHPMQS